MMLMNSTTIVSFPELDLGPWTINRFLVENLFGTLSIAWYGVIICVAMVLAAAIILRYAVKKEGMNLDSFLDYFLLAIPLGVVGARTMYVLARLEEYKTFSDMIAIWEGGIAIFGAIIAGAITIFVLAKIKKQPVLKIFDAFVPGLLIAQSLGRWGNFINGEAFGETVTHKLPWGMIVNGIGPVHPTFLYESIITFVGFLLVVFFVYRYKKEDGQVLSFYLVWYGIGRTLVEGLRTDSLMIGDTGLRLAQCIGILAALCGILLFVLPLVLKQGSEEKKEKTEEEKETENKEETEENTEEVLEEKTEKSSEETKETEEKEGEE